MKWLILVVVMLLMPIEIMAVGMGVAPSEVIFDVEKGSRQQKELTVYNLQEETTEFEVRTDAAFLEFFHNGMIEGMDGEKVVVQVDAATLDKGSYRSTIYITTFNHASGVKLNLGSAVKVKVNVFETNKNNVAIAVLVTIVTAIAGVLAYFAMLRIKTLVKMVVKT